MAGDYTVLSQVKLNKYDAARQQAIEGWNITVQWHRGDTTFTVFVPGELPSAADVDAAIRSTGYNTETIGALGAGPSSPPAKG